MKTFIIDHIDPFGQGVFKSEQDIYFIPKTLPEETGTFQVLKKRKGVHFCELLKLEKTSSKRVPAECVHYEECNGCHYLHTDYDSELEFKKASLQKIISQLFNT